MIKFKRIQVAITVVLALGYSIPSAAEQYVDDTNIVLQTDDIADFKFTVFQDFAGTDPTSILFDVNANSTTAFLTISGITLDQGSDWYLVELDDFFNEVTICEGEFFFWGGFEKSSSIPDIGHVLELPFGEYYLGVNTGRGFPVDPPPRDVFGWARIRVSGDNAIELLDNSVVYGGRGIVIGQSAAIPEPTSTGWMLVAMIGLWSSRRRGAY